MRRGDVRDVAFEPLNARTLRGLVRAAGSPGRRERTHLKHLSVVAPREQVRQRVRADHVDDVPVGPFGADSSKRVDRVRASRPEHLGVGDGKLPRGRESGHLEPVLREHVAVLVRRVAGRQKHRLVEPQLLPGRAQKREMPQVHRSSVPPSIPIFLRSILLLYPNPPSMKSENLR